MLQIEQANGLDNESYAEPIQRLSDLEWLAYKDANRSVVDDLFTGQLVDAQHCVACNRISVSIQPFRTLALALSEARGSDGLVYLEDCFASFAHVERLSGSNGLHCATCSTPWLPAAAAAAESPSVLVSPIEQPGVARRRRGECRGTLEAAAAAAAAASPIPKARDLFNDSGFHDNRFRTSTPIAAGGAGGAGAGRGGGKPRLTDGQHRSLLRQLPDCLTVQLLRFTSPGGGGGGGGETRKLTRPVAVPIARLDLTHLLIDSVLRRDDIAATGGPRLLYDLYAVSTHHGGDGGIAGGHYVAYAADADGRWHCFDDDRVTPVNMAYELKTRRVRENVYLLFYKRSLV